MNPKRWLAFITLALIWGSTWITANALQLPPLRASAIRFLLSALFLLPFIARKRWPWPRGRALRYLLLLSVSMVVVPLLLLLWARPQLPSATVLVSFAAMPLIVALLTNTIEGRTVPYRALQATIVGLAGITLAAGITFSLAQAEAAVVVLVAVVATAASSLVARRELKGLHPCVLTACLLAPAAVLLLAASLIFERGQIDLWDRGAATAILLLSLVAGSVAYSIYFWLLQEVEAYQIAMLQWLQPIVGFAESALYLRVGFSFTMAAGILVTLGSVLMVAGAREEDDKTASLRAD